MKIGMMVDRYKPYISGITNYVSLNKKYLEAAGEEVSIFTFGDETYADDETLVYRTHGIQLPKSGYYFNINYDNEARRHLHQMDLVHVHHPILSGSLALRYCKPRGIPIIFTNHTRYDLYAQAYGPSWLPDTLGETAMRTLLPSFCEACDLVISPSPGLAEILVEYGVESRVEIVPNGVDLAPFHKSGTPIERSQLGIPANAVLLIYAGRLGPEKNLHFLLRSFNGVVNSYPNVHLLLVGDGPERSNLESQARHLKHGGQVHFAGMVTYQDLPSYLWAADAFVTASVTEVHPLTVIEAMAAGLPVLGIRSPGVGDTVEDGVSGVLSDNDLADFTARMARIASDGELRQQLGDQAAREVSRYAIERTCARMIEVYTEVIQATRTKRSNWGPRMYRAYDRFVKF